MLMVKIPFTRIRHSVLRLRKFKRAIARQVRKEYEHTAYKGFHALKANTKKQKEIEAK